MSLHAAVSASLQSALALLGEEVRLYKNGERFTFHASLQPGPEAQPGPGPAGGWDGLSCRYRGPARDGGELLEEGDLLEAGGRFFRSGPIRDYRAGGRAVLRAARLLPCCPPPGGEVGP